MGRLVGKIIGGVVGGAFAIGGAVTISQLDAQTDEINKQVDAMNVLAVKVSEEYTCYAEAKCEVVGGTEEEYEDLAVENDKRMDEYNDIVNQYNKDCTEDGIDKSEEQKCLDLNNNAAKMVEELTGQLEKLDAFVEDI